MFLHILLLSAALWDQRIYLATYPRSGNHWMRYLIEEVTGVATGSVYPESDPQHLKKAFPFKAYCCDHGYEGHCVYPKEGEPFVVKTHFPARDKQPFDKLPCMAALRIVRHPIASIYSEYVYKHKPPEKIVPHSWVVKTVADWKRFQEYWNRQPNVVTLIYEDLFDHPESALKQALSAVHLEFTDADIARAVEKHPPRSSLTNHRAHFTESDLNYIENELKDLIAQFYP